MATGCTRCLICQVEHEMRGWWYPAARRQQRTKEYRQTEYARRKLRLKKSPGA